MSSDTYGGGPPCVRDSVTSTQSAEAIAPRITDLQAVLLRFLLERGPEGATDDEMQAATGMNPSTQRPRRCELVEMGRVRDGGKTRKTRAGRRAVVWVMARKNSVDTPGGGC